MPRQAQKKGLLRHAAEDARIHCLSGRLSRLADAGVSRFGKIAPTDP